MSSDSAPFAEGNFDPALALELEDKFSTADALDIEADNSEPPEEIWGGLRLAPGQLMEIIGGSGLGKSRMMLNLAVNQVLGRDFAGLPTCKRPLKWLFYGNENGFYRYRNDLRQMLKSCTADERERLRGHIFLPTMSKPKDAYVSFADEQNRTKLKMTIRYRDADVVVLDPWGAVIDGDELDDGDVRKTIFEIMDVLAANVKKPTAGIILNHSRNGIKELVDAAGFGAANYGKNSKAIFSVMRNVWNLRPAHFAEPVTKIELIHAKSSDFAAYEPRAVDFDPNTFTYSLDPNFNHDAWQYELERARRNGSGMTSEKRAIEAKQKAIEIRKQILDHVTSLGHIYKRDLDEWRVEKGLPENTYRVTCASLVNDGELAKIKERLSGFVVLGTPTEIYKILQSAPKGTYLV